MKSIVHVHGRSREPAMNYSLFEQSVQGLSDWMRRDCVEHLQGNDTITFVIVIVADLRLRHRCKAMQQ